MHNKFQTRIPESVKQNRMTRRGVAQQPKRDDSQSTFPLRRPLPPPHPSCAYYRPRKTSWGVRAHPSAVINVCRSRAATAGLSPAERVCVDRTSQRTNRIFSTTNPPHLPNNSQSRTRSADLDCWTETKHQTFTNSQL